METDRAYRQEGGTGTSVTGEDKPEADGRAKRKTRGARGTQTSKMRNRHILAAEGGGEGERGNGEETTERACDRGKHRESEAARGTREEWTSARAGQTTTRMRSDTQRQEEVAHVQDTRNGGGEGKEGEGCGGG